MFLNKQLRAALGSSLRDLVQVDATGLERLLSGIGEKLQEQERQASEPAWLAQLERRIAAVEATVAEVASTAEARPVPELNPATASSEEMAAGKRVLREMISREELERRLAIFRSQVSRADEVAKLEVTSRILSFSIELERLRKMVEVAPGARDLEALHESWAGKLKAAKVVLLERLEAVERDTKVETKEESLRLESVVRELEIQSHESIERLQERSKALEEDLELLVDEAHRNRKEIEARIAEVQSKCFGEMNEIRSKLKVQGHRMDEVHGLALALEKTQQDLALRASEIQALISTHEEKAEAISTDFLREVETLQEHIAANGAECAAVRDETATLSERLADCSRRGDVAERTLEEHAARLEASTARADQLKEAVERLREDDVVALRKLSDDIRTEARANTSALDETVGEHSTQLKLFMGRLKRAEHEVFRIMPPTLAEHDELLKDLGEALNERASEQKAWNATTAGRLGNLEDREAADVLAIRGEQDAHAAGLAGLDAYLLATSRDVQNDRKNLAALAETATRHHGELTEAIGAFRDDSANRFERQESHLATEVANLREHVKVLFISMEEEMSTKLKHSHNSPIHLCPEDQKIFLRNQAAALAKLAVKFEHACHDKANAALELSRDACKTISLVTQEVAEYIALKADVWAVETQIHGAPEDAAYGDDAIDTRRLKLLRNFVDLLAQDIQSRSPEPGAIRRDARAKALRKIKSAFDMALTKFDRVTITGASRLLSRALDTPKCVTCDRPLAYRRPSRTLDMPCGRPESAAPQLNHSSPNFRPTTADPRGPQSFGTSSNAASSPNNSIMRSGFKLPRAHISPDLQRMLEPNVVAAKRAADLETDPILQDASILSSASFPTLFSSSIIPSPSPN